MEDKHAESLFGEDYALCVRYCGRKTLKTCTEKRGSGWHVSVCLRCVFVSFGRDAGSFLSPVSHTGQVVRLPQLFLPHNSPFGCVTLSAGYRKRWSSVKRERELAVCLLCALLHPQMVLITGPLKPVLCQLVLAALLSPPSFFVWWWGGWGSCLLSCLLACVCP